jgi:hypothetical protein
MLHAVPVTSEMTIGGSLTRCSQAVASRTCDGLGTASAPLLLDGRAQCKAATTVTSNTAGMIHRRGRPVKNPGRATS